MKEGEVNSSTIASPASNLVENLSHSDFFEKIETWSLDEKIVVLRHLIDILHPRAHNG